MRCGDCKYYEPARNPDTNRQLPSQDGDCTYPVEWPKLPKCFLPDPFTHRGAWRRVEFPQRSPVWKDNKEKCDMFKARPDKKKSSGQIALAMHDE